MHLDLAPNLRECVGPPEAGAEAGELYAVAPVLPPALKDHPSVVHVRGKPYTRTCSNTLWLRGLRFDTIVDTSPEKSFANCQLLVEEFPRLLVAGSGRLEVTCINKEWIPKLLMAMHDDVRTCAHTTGDTIIVDLSLSQTAWIDRIGKQVGLPDPLARRAFLIWLCAALVAQMPDTTITVVDLVSHADSQHFLHCATHALKDRGIVLQRLPPPATAVHVLRLGDRQDLWDARARQALHFDGVVLFDGLDNFTDMPFLRVVDLGIATQDLSLLRLILEKLPKDVLHA